MVRWCAGDHGQSEAHQQLEACRRGWYLHLRPQMPLYDASAGQEQDCEDGAVSHLQSHQVWQAASPGLHPHVPAHGLHQRSPSLFFCCLFACVSLLPGLALHCTCSPCGAMCSMQHATCGIQWAFYSLQTCGMQHTACKLWRATCK